MLKYIRQLILTGLVALPLLIAVPQIVHADDPAPSPTFKSSACTGVSQVGGGSCEDNGSTFISLFNTVVSVLSIVIGFVAVVMILVGGFKYITSGGDAGKVGSAKNTIIYALVGIAVAALAQALVHFVLNTTSETTTPCGNHSYSQADSRCTAAEKK